MYRPRGAEHTVLHQVIREHLEVFLREAAEAGEGVGLPQFVEREFREFLTCGVLAHGTLSANCGQWTNGAFTESGQIGASGVTDDRWTNLRLESCGSTFHLYGFEK